MQNKNAYGQAIGPMLENWSKREWPADVILTGQFCRLEPLSVAAHADALFEAYQLAPNDSDWTYLFREAFHDREEFVAYIAEIASQHDPKFYAVIDVKTNQAVGFFSLMRIDPNHGVIEVGHVTFSPLLKRTTASTEAQFLLMQYVFESLQYRRYEWKCDSLNAPSRRTAERLGFTFEGVFRQAVVYKGRSRDTAWFSIVDGEWPAIKQAYLNWLSEANFDEHGAQRQRLEAFF